MLGISVVMKLVDKCCGFMGFGSYWLIVWWVRLIWFRLWWVLIYSMFCLWVLWVIMVMCWLFRLGVVSVMVLVWL